MSRCPKGGTHSGARPSSDRKYEITRIKDDHHEIMRLMVLGWTNKQINIRYGHSLAKLCAVRNSTLTSKQINLMQAHRNYKVATAQTVLDESAKGAAEVLTSVMNDTEQPARLRVDTAKSVLDRTGHGPTHKFKGDINHTVFSRDDFNTLQERLDKAVEEGAVIEAEFSEVE